MQKKKNKQKYEKHQQMMKDKQQQRQTKKSLKKQRGQARSLKGYAKHFQEFQDEMNQLGLQIRDVEGDGNCLFRSIADVLHGDEKYHKQLRKLAVQTMQENQEFFGLFIEDDMTFDQYSKEMSSDGEWGGNLELQALSQALDVNFFIHMKGRPCMIIKSMTDERPLNEKDSLHLAYHLIENVAEHYSSVRMLGDDSNKRAEQIPLDIFEGLLDTFQQAPLGNEDNYDQFDDFEQIEDPEEREYLQALREQEEAEKAAKEAMKKAELQKYQLKQKKNKKCNCGSNKTYKDCCMNIDIEKAEKQKQPKQQQQQQQQQQPQPQQQSQSDAPMKKQAVFI